MASSISSRRVFTVSLIVDIIDVVTCLVGAILTGSAVVFAEMAQGLADVAGSGFLVIGERRSRRPRDATHPFGFDREVFFWALLSAVVMLVVGGGLSFWRGYQQLVEPETLSRPFLAFAVLILEVVTNGYAVSLSARKLGQEEGRSLEAFWNSSRPLLKTALLRDGIGTFSAVLSVFAVGLYLIADLVVFDALGAILVGALMTASSLVVIAQVQGLITGRSVPEQQLELIRAAVVLTPGVDAMNRVAAVYSGSEQIFVELDLDLSERLTTTEVEEILDAIQKRIQDVVPQARSVRVDLNSPESGR